MLKSKKSNFSVFLKSFLISGVAVGTLLLVLMAYITHEDPVGGDFSLTVRGEPWSFSQQPLELNLFYIGYAKCPDVCPLTLSFAGQAFRQLSEKELSRVRLMFLSVDYENDNPNDVADYASQFHPSFLGLSGSEDQIKQAVSLYQTHFFVENDPSSYLGYSIAHPDRLFFLNKKGHVVASISGPRSAEVILEILKDIL